MPYPDRSPFEILEISPDATIDEIIKAYPQAIKNKRFPPGILAKVFSELRNARKRAEYDLLVRYDLSDTAAIQDFMSQLHPYNFLPNVINPLPVTLELTDLSKVNTNVDFHPPPDCPLSLETTDQYQDLETTFISPSISS
jgi:hypothetical protein